MWTLSFPRLFTHIRLKGMICEERCVRSLCGGGDGGDRSSDESVVQEQIVNKFSCVLALFKSLISVVQSP